MKKILITWMLLLGIVSNTYGSEFVIRSSDDWSTFKSMVEAAKGQYPVDARLEADIAVKHTVGLDASFPYTGTFNGNGHTIDVNISGGSLSHIALFGRVKDVLIKNLHITGKVSGGMHPAGLIGYVQGDGHSITIDHVWVSTEVTSTQTHAGGIIGHSNKADVYVYDCRFDGSIITNNIQNQSYIGCIIGWCNGGGWTFHRVYNCSKTLTAWRIWFCADYNSNTGEIKPWGSNGL